MKKILAIVLSALIAATAAYTAIAANEDEKSSEIINSTDTSKLAEDVSGAVEKGLDALKDDASAKAMAEEIKKSVVDGGTTEDINATLGALVDYVNGNGYDVGRVKNGKETKAFIGSFLEDCGVDSEAVFEAYDKVKGNGGSSSSSSSSSNGGSTATGTNGGSSEGLGYVEEDYVGSSDLHSSSYYGVDSTTIPDTGYTK